MGAVHYWERRAHASRWATRMRPMDGWIEDGGKERQKNGQPEHFWCISGLNTVSLALPRVSCHNREILACDGQNRPSVFGVRVETAFLWCIRGKRHFLWRILALNGRQSSGT